jgi:hypothetical protein
MSIRILLSIVIAVGALIVAASLGGIGKNIGKLAVQSTTPAAENTEQDLIDGIEKAAKKLNKDTPRMIDADTRMDAATIGPGLRININYTLPKHAAGEIDAEQLIQHMRPTLENYACNKKNMKTMMQWGAIIAYSYHAKDQSLITNILIDRDDCGLGKISP